MKKLGVVLALVLMFVIGAGTSVFAARQNSNAGMGHHRRHHRHHRRHHRRHHHRRAGHMGGNTNS